MKLGSNRATAAVHARNAAPDRSGARSHRFARLLKIEHNEVDLEKYILVIMFYLYFKMFTRLKDY